MNRAMIAARNSTTATCHTPLPMRCTSRSPSATPIATPTASSATRRTDRSVGEPERDPRADGREERVRVPDRVPWRSPNAIAAASDACRIGNHAAADPRPALADAASTSQRPDAERRAVADVPGTAPLTASGAAPGRGSGVRGRRAGPRTRRRPARSAPGRPRPAPPSHVDDQLGVHRHRPLDHGQRDRTELVVPRDGRHLPDRPGRAPASRRSGPRRAPRAPGSGSRCPDPSRCSMTRRRGGRPRLCTRATVSCPR